MENKTYFVLSIKGTPVADEKSEADNPYAFRRLSLAFKFAEQLNKETDLPTTVVELKDIEVIGNI